MCQFVLVLDKLPKIRRKKKRNGKCHFEVGPTLSFSEALYIAITCGVINKLSLLGILVV